MSQETAPAAEVEIDLDNWGLPEIATPAKPVNKFFQKEADHTAVLDDEPKEKPAPADNPDPAEKPAEVDVASILDDEVPATEAEVEAEKVERVKTDKSALIEFLKEEIEAGRMENYDEFDATKQTLDEYLNGLSKKDAQALLKGNVAAKEEAARKEGPGQLFASLPEKLQTAVKYALDGGADLEGMFTALGQVTRINNLDPEKEGDQESIVRNYLQAKDYGTAEEIEAEITSMKDLGKLPEKASIFKPRLDKMQEEILQAKTEQAALANEQRKESAKMFTKNVYEALKPADLNGLKITDRQQSELYYGLTEIKHPSIRGGMTNELGFLLEKYQFGPEADFKVISEVLLLLRDRTGYRGSIGTISANEATAEIVKKIKTTQGGSGSSLAAAESTDASRTVIKKSAIPRPSANIFKR